MAVVVAAGVLTGLITSADAFGVAADTGFFTTAAGVPAAGWLVVAGVVVVAAFTGSGSEIGVISDVGFGNGFASVLAKYVSRPASLSKRRL